MVRFRGPEAILSRIEEIQAKIDSINPKKEAPTAFPDPIPQPNPMPTPLPGMTGSIGGAGFQPLNPAFLGITPTVDKSQILTMVRSAAAKHGLDPALFESLVEQESSFNPRSVSGAGAMGLTQLMPSTARLLGVSDPMDPAQNLDGGARYLAQMLKEFGGDRSLALAAYNAGPGAVKKYSGIPPYNETQNYVTKILARTAERSGG